MKHIAKLRKKNSYWQLVDAQAVQDISDRIDRSYKLFFKHSCKGVRPPSFCKSIKYRSFTLKQTGYKLIGNKIRLGKRIFGYHKSRQIEGKIKTVTVKRVSTGDIYIFVVTDARNAKHCQSSKTTICATRCTEWATQVPGETPGNAPSSIRVVTSKIAGFDFGLKTFLTNSNGSDIKSPQFLLKAKKEVRSLSQKLSSKKLGSRNWNKARIKLAKLHQKITNQRRDWFWKLSQRLCDIYDVMCFESLNLKGMQRLWGRKISDLAFSSFLEILLVVAATKGKQVVFVGQWFASSKLCSNCGHKHSELQLRDRHWDCPSCGASHDRDRNAALNIEREGASSLKGGDVRRSKTAVAV